MDVDPGLCFQCGVKKSTTKCVNCNIAEYCGDRCMERDKLLHQIDCNMWNIGKQCGMCKKKTDCRLCASCREIAYCGRECQDKHWPVHKGHCKATRKHVKEIAEKYKTKLSSVIDEQTLYDPPYYFGNTIAVDVLKLAFNEAGPASKNIADGLSKDYNVLLAGVGDLRNLLLTTALLPRMFTGNINFTLNDVDPFILARNVLFLYMILTGGSNPSIAISITNIWYSLQLPDKDFHFLKSTLNELIRHTVKTIKSKTDGKLDIEKNDLETLKDVWKKWSEMECETFKFNSINLFAQRSLVFRDLNFHLSVAEYIAQISHTAYTNSAKNFFINGLFLPQFMTEEERSNLKYDNPTLTGRPQLVAGDELPKLSENIPKSINFRYCIRSDLWPFYSWDIIEAEKVCQTDSIVNVFHTYITSVILSAISYFEKGVIYSKISLSKCTELGNQVIQQKFDRIMTSNICDYTGITSLLSSMRPLLSTTNEHAVVVMETLNMRRCCPEADANHLLNQAKLNILGSIILQDNKYQKLHPRHMYDYLDNTALFLRYLRGIFLISKEEAKLKENCPLVPDIFQNVEGFRLRNFTVTRNKVVPFRYRVNARICSGQSGVHRNLEWKLAITKRSDVA